MAEENDQYIRAAEVDEIFEMLPLYATCGSFAPYYLGIKPPISRIENPVVVPTTAMLWYEAHAGASRTNDFQWLSGHTVFEIENSGYYPILETVSAGEVLKRLGLGKNQQLALDLSRLSYAATEGSFISGGYTDLLRGLRVGLAYYIVQDYYHQKYGSPMWQRQLEFDEMEEITAQIPDLPEFTGSTFLLDTPGFLFGPNPKLFARNIARFNAFLGSLARGDIEMARYAMKFHPDVVAHGAGFLFTLMKANLLQKVFPGETMDKNLALALANTETSPNPNILYDPVTLHFATTHAIFSTYLDMVLDLPLQSHAPRTFAFINRCLADELKIPDYITRMRATRGSLDLTTAGLSSLNKAISLGEFKTPVETVPKSIFTSGAEVLEKEVEAFFGLLNRYDDIKKPEAEIQQEWDYEALEALDQLLAKREEFSRKGLYDDELDAFLLRLYHEIKRTSDILRGTVYWPGIDYEGLDTYDDVVYEALQKDYTSVLVLNYHDAEGSHPFIRPWKSRNDIAASAKELGLATAKPSDILAHWYRKHGLLKKPYAAIHIQADAHYAPTIFRGNDLPFHHETEIRLTTVDDMYSFHISREDYRHTRKSRHVRL